MMASEIYELAKWYVDEAAKLTSFGDEELLSFVVARKNALKKWTVEALSRILGEGFRLSLCELRRRITKILGDLNDTYIEEYYSLIEKILSRKMRAAIDEYIDDIPSWGSPLRIEQVKREKRKNVLAFWNAISGGRAYPSTR